jgi:hypothetical protein
LGNFKFLFWFQIIYDVRVFGHYFQLFLLLHFFIINCCELVNYSHHDSAGVPILVIRFKDVPFGLAKPYLMAYYFIHVLFRSIVDLFFPISVELWNIVAVLRIDKALNRSTVFIFSPNFYTLSILNTLIVIFSLVAVCFMNQLRYCFLLS